MRPPLLAFLRQSRDERFLHSPERRRRIKGGAKREEWGNIAEEDRILDLRNFLSGEPSSPTTSLRGRMASRGPRWPTSPGSRHIRNRWWDVRVRDLEFDESERRLR